MTDDHTQADELIEDLDVDEGEAADIKGGDKPTGSVKMNEIHFTHLSDKSSQSLGS